jgi:hypothetical protein
VRTMGLSVAAQACTHPKQTLDSVVNASTLCFLFSGVG